MSDLTHVEAQMLACIGSSIAGARSAGKPDPTDDELTFDLSDGFAAADIRASLSRLKGMALGILRGAAELAALAIFLAVTIGVAGILRGVI